MLGLGVVGLILLILGLWLLLTGHLIFGILLIVIALLFGGGWGYGYRRRGVY